MSTTAKYDRIVSRIVGFVERDIEGRFAIGRLAHEALQLPNVTYLRLSADTGVQASTLQTYVKAYRFWGDDRIPVVDGKQPTWQTYSWATTMTQAQKKRVLRLGRLEFERIRRAQIESTQAQSRSYNDSLSGTRNHFFDETMMSLDLAARYLEIACRNAPLTQAQCAELMEAHDKVIQRIVVRQGKVA